MQEQGHTAVIILGDFTATIGDPTGRSDARKPVSKEAIESNTQKLEQQIRQILLPDSLEIHRNSRWLSTFSTEDLLNKLSLVGVNTILSRKDFKQRLADGNRIGLNELIYPVLQSLDSIEVQPDVEVGGNDQKFNLLLARDLQKKVNQKPQAIVLFPLLPNKLGGKMGKSSGNCISLDLPEKDIWDKLISTPDDLLDDFLRILTDEQIPENTIPQQKQKILAEAVTDQLKENKQRS